MLEEDVQRKGDAVAAMRPVLGQTLADIQARLIFRAEAFIKVAQELNSQGSPSASIRQPQLQDLQRIAEL